MAPKITKSQKLELVKRLRELKEKHISLLIAESERISKRCEAKAIRRSKNVSVTIQLVKILDILQLERQRSPTLADLQRLAASTRE